VAGICAKYRVSTDTLLRVVKMWGLPLRGKDQTVRRRRGSPKAERNAELVARHQAGESAASLAREYGISRVRAGQIIARAARPPDD
jgi:Mor family transcriptional regulator